MVNNTAKLSVPKLNLNVLPNYHKRSEKCLNDALLEAYHQKHGVQNTLSYDWLLSLIRNSQQRTLYQV